MANKKITDATYVSTLTNSDTLFVNADGGLRQIALSDMSIDGGMYDLLWENPNPTTAFAAQTIALDLSGYDAVEIDFYNGTTYKGRVGTENMNAVYVNSSGRVVANRWFSVLPTGVTVTDSQNSTANATAVTNNNVLVPYRIYGVRNSLTSLLAPSVKIDKLWTNPSPDAAFAAQTVNLDLNKYDKVEIVYRGHGWDGTAEITANMHTVISVGGVGILNNSGMSTSNSYYTYAKTRKATVNASGVAFSTGYVSRITGEPSQDNNACIPQEIYGIKVETQPVIGGITMELLWENASPTSEFAASQTISLDLAQYDLVKIHFNLDSNQRAVNSFDTPLNRACMYEILGYTRHFTVTDTGVSFSACTDVGTAIPLAIYGIRGVQ
jgi:hypothetical protein